jgi:hypothetical protein
MGALEQPVVGEQESAVHPFLSLQSWGVPLPQAPLKQAPGVKMVDAQEPVPQGVPSSALPNWQFPLTASQPVATMHVGAGHFFCSPMHAPFEHVSPFVQALWSSQDAVLGVWLQLPSTGLHASSVQTFPSVQLFGVPAHVPFVQTSFVVQRFLSSHTAPLLGGWTHPIVGEQVSAVQGSPSSPHTVIGCTHTPSVQASVVQRLLSLHSLASLHCTHLPVESQTPVAQGLSSMGMGSWVAAPATHFSTVQGFPSSAGTSVSSSCDVDLPLPSQTTFWQSPAITRDGGTVAPAAFLGTQLPSVQAAIWQGFVTTQSLLLMQFAQTPSPSHLSLPPVPHAALDGRSVTVSTPPAHVAVLQSTASGTSLSSFTVFGTPVSQMACEQSPFTGTTPGSGPLSWLCTHVFVPRSQLSVVHAFMSSQTALLAQLTTHLPPVQTPWADPASHAVPSV